MEDPFHYITITQYNAIQYNTQQNTIPDPRHCSGDGCQRNPSISVLIKKPSNKCFNKQHWYQFKTIHTRTYVHTYCTLM